MSSVLPQDLKKVVCDPAQASTVERVTVALGQWTANNTVTKLGLPFDRAGVIREIWFAADAVPVDADGTLLINAKVQDVSEGAADSIVASFDCETTITAAKHAYQATFAAEDSENQWTVEAGDVLYFELVNNSAAIGTNANVTALVLMQYFGTL